ncbi:Dystonin [Operophtera brumata]|uniref:Dystonin n=1 Tax=Operophtera brumata TaxID=104452 RepID=A0A0L7LWB3_OPEBR|nr:Dystonin [Operophtera brumata]
MYMSAAFGMTSFGCLFSLSSRTQGLASETNVRNPFPTNETNSEIESGNRRLVESMAPRSARSFRQEFNMQDLTTETTYTTHYTSEKFVRSSHSTELDGQAPIKSIANGKLSSPNYTTRTIISEDDRPDVRKLKRVQNMYGGPNIVESRGIVHPETKEILTVGQAINMRILDVRTGRLLSSLDTRQTMTIDQAAKEGLIDPKLAARLTGPCGTTEDGNEVTLLEAIQIELYDAEQGVSDPAEKRIKVTVESERPSQGMSISDALTRGQVDLQRGLYRLPSGSYITIAEAYERGYLIYKEIIKIKSSALSLSDAISQDLVDNSGWILDRNSGDRFQLDIAINNELINPNVREIVDHKNDTKVTLAEAIEKNIINSKHSRYVHNMTKEKLSFKDAANKRYICKPMTLKDVCDSNLMTNDNKILSPANRSPLNILESISGGVLDSDNVKCITDTTTGQLLTLTEALGAKIILLDSKFRDNLTGEICSIPEAVDRGLITSVSQRSIFDIDGFRDSKTGEFVSFNVALSKGYLKYANGETFLKSESGDFVFLEDCTKVSIVRPEVLEMFNRKIGIYESGKELSVLDAVFKNILDPKTGNLLDSTTKKPIPFNKAVEINMITPEGAALLNSLLNITLTLQTVTKTIKRYVTVTNTSAQQRSETIVTFAEAIKRGLIDENKQTFMDPSTGTIMPIQQALDQGLLGVEQNEPRVVHISDRVTKKELLPGQVVELKITKKSFFKDLPLSPEGKVQRDSRPETVKSPDFTIRETIPSREGSTQEIRTITKQSVVTEPSVTSLTIKKNTIELPRGGWTLKDAIQQNLFDPAIGLFTIPGTDRVMDLNEAIKLNIINPNSAKVKDPKTKKELPLDKALELRVIDNQGRYKHATVLHTMIEAIERQYIILIQMITTTSSQKVITITSVAGMPDKMEVSEVFDTPFESATEDQFALEPVQVSPGIIFDPATALVISTSTGVSENILEAVNRGVVPSRTVSVVDPKTGKPITLKQALDKGIVDKRTGEYRDKSGKKVSLVDAAKIGLVAVVGAPLVAASKVIQLVKSTMVVDPQTGEKLPMEVAYERGLVDQVTYKKYEDSIRDKTPESEIYRESQISSSDTVTFSQVITKSSPLSTSTITYITDPRTGKEVPIEEAYAKGLIDPVTFKQYQESPENQETVTKSKVTTATPSSSKTVTVVVDPNTGEKLPLEVACERGLIDPISFKKYELSTREDTPERVTSYEITLPSSSTVTFTPETEVTMVVDPKTGEQVTIDEALNRRLVDPETYNIYKGTKTIKSFPGVSKSGTSTVTIAQTTAKPISVGAAVSEGFITVESIQNSLSADNRKVLELTTQKSKVPSDVVQINKTSPSEKPKYKINIAREGTPETHVMETKPIVLQKLRKRVITPLEAVEKGLIDKQTAKILEAVRVYKDENKAPITLDKAIEIGLVEENTGKIVDPVHGDVVSIKEALKRSILDGEGQDEILIPLARSLSIPEVLEQGLLDPATGKIIHPETGNLLTLREAIICEIVDPLSSITMAPGKKITLAEAIEKNIIDNEKNTVKSSDGPLDLISAVNVHVFPTTEQRQLVEDIPPAAMTLNVAIKKNLINPHTGEIRHPLTGEIIPIGEAIEKDLIMAIPYPQTTETVSLEDALDKGIVNLKYATYTDPNTREVVPIEQALEKGLLAVKPTSDVMQASGVVTTITETFSSQHTITTKMIELLADYVLVSATEVQSTTTGEIISIEEARAKGIVRDEQISKEEFLTSDTHFNFDDALNLGYINIETGTFTHPKTGEVVSISDAVISGVLNTEVLSESAKTVSPSRKELQMLDLNEAFEILFDEKTQKFRNPKSSNKELTFKEALEKKIINPDSVIYNVAAGKPVTLKEALDTGLIDKKTGKLKEPKTGKSVDIKNAAKMGLIAVVAAPVLAGMAVVQGAKAVGSKILQPKQERAVESPSRIVPAKVTSKLEIVDYFEPVSKTPQVIAIPKPIQEIVQQEKTQKPVVKESPKPTQSKTDITGQKPVIKTSNEKVDDKPSAKQVVSKEAPNITSKIEHTTIESSAITTEIDNIAKQQPQEVLKKTDKPQAVPVNYLPGDKKHEKDSVTTDKHSPQEPKDSTSTNDTPLAKGVPSDKEVPEKREPKRIINIEEKVVEGKPIVEEYRQMTPEGEELYTIIKTTTSKTLEYDTILSETCDVTGLPTYQSATQQASSEYSILDGNLTDKDSPKTSKQTEYLTSDKHTTKPKDTSGLLVEQQIVKGTPVVQEFRQNTPDGEVTTLVKTIVSTSEPTEYVTEHSSTVITTSSSRVTKVTEFSQSESTYQVVTEELPGPHESSETTIQEYRVESPDDDEIDQCQKHPHHEVKEIHLQKDSSPTETDKFKKPKDKSLDDETNKTPETSKLNKGEISKPVEVVPGVIYDPNTSVVISATSGVTDNLWDAVQDGVIPSESVVVKDPKSGKEITLKEAINKGVVNKKTGELRDPSGKKMSIGDAAKLGALAVVGAPIFAASKIIEVVKKAVVVDPKTGEKVPLDQARDKGLVKPETYKKLEEAIQVQTSGCQITKPDDITVSHAEINIQPVVKHPKDFIFTEQVITTHTSTTKTSRPSEVTITETTEHAPVISATTPVEKKTMEIPTLTKTTIHDGKTVSAMLIDAERQPLRVIDEITEQNVTKEKSEPIKPLYENIPLIDAIAQSKIEPKVCRIVINGVESSLTVQDSLEQEQISRFTPVDVISKNYVIVRESKPTYFVAISHRITPEELSEMGVYDIEKQIFLNPETGVKISFEELVYGLQIFDPESILVKDLTSKHDNYITFDEAIAIPIIDNTTGHMVHPKTGKRVPFLECIQLGWIVEKPEDVSVPEQVTIESAIEQGLYNPKTGEIKDINTGALVSIGKAVEKGLVDQETLLIKVPRSNEVISLADAVDRGIIEIYEGVITIIETRETIEISVAIQRGIITIIRKPISIEAVIVKELYEPKTGKIKDKVTDQLISISDAVDRNIVHPTISEIKDTASNKLVPLLEALETKLINPETAKIKDKKTGKDIPLDDALKKGLIVTKAVTFSLLDVIELGYYSPETGKILNPRTGDVISLKEAINVKLVDPSDVKIKDDTSEVVVTFEQAVKSGLIDLDKGIITSPVINLKDASDKGYFLSDKKPWTLQEGLVQGFYDPETGLLTINGVTMTLEDAIKDGNINPKALTVRNSVTGEIISLADAIKIGIIDSKEGKVRDPILGDKISLTDASERGLIVPAKRNLSLPEAVFKGFYDPKTGKFSHPQSKEKIQTDRAIKKRMIDPQSTLVHVAGKVIPFEFAVDKGIVDGRTGTIVLGPEKIDFREAFERGILVEVRKPLSLMEALEKGVYNEITGLFMDPQSGKKYTLADAIKMNLIDPNSVHIRDNRFGKWDKITLPESLETGVIDDQTGKIRNINSDNEEITLRRAFEIGLLVDSKAPISLQRALHQGLYEDSTGKIIDPATNRKITLHEAIRKSIISPKYLCYFDKKSEKPLSLADCVRSEIVDRRSGKFHEPGSDVFIPLSEAMSLGLVVDIESAGFTLYETLAMNMYNITELVFIHPVTESKISLKSAIVEEFINPETSLVKHIPSSKYIKLNEAIETGVIDDENNVYNLPNGNQINFYDAKHRGLIVTTKKHLSLEEIIRNGLFRADNGKIVDPNTNEYVDINKAIETNLLNPDSTVVKDNFTNKFKPLPLAIQQGDVDVTRGRVLDTKVKKTYSLDIAFDKGLLVTVVQPITSQTVIKRYVSEASASKESILREFTLDEAVKYEFIDPETAVIKDPHKNKYIPLKLGIVEGIIDNNAKGLFDTQNRSKTLCFVFENGLIVYVREPLTFEQAVENGQLNLATARFTDPQSNEVLTIKDAAILGYIDPDTALVKDNLKKRLVKLPEAFRKGLMDAEKGNILDTETSKLNTLTAAIESGLLMTPKKSFSLIETLNFGIYNPTTGALNDPFITTSVIDRKRLNLGEAINQRIVDASSTVVKEPETGKIWPLVQAMEQKLVDPVEGRLVVDRKKGIKLDLVKALKKGYLLPAETRLIKDDLDSHQRQVSACADQAKQLLVSGGDVLAPHEVRIPPDDDVLPSHHYLHQRDTNEVNTFNTWMESAYRTLEEKEAALSKLNNLPGQSEDACDQLVKSLEGNLTPSEIRHLEVPVIDLSSNYKDLTEAVGSKCAELEAALLHVIDLTSNYKDLTESISHNRNQSKPASLIRERLDEQVREHRIQQGELDSRRPTLGKLLSSARDAAMTPSNARIAKKLEQRAEDIYSKDKQMPLLEECLRNGKQLISKPDVTDTHVVRDKLKALEAGWRDVNTTLEERQKLAVVVIAVSIHQVVPCVQVLDWLQSMESRVTRLQPVAVDLEVLKKQQEELRPLAKEYRDYAITIEKLSDVNNRYSLVGSKLSDRQSELDAIKEEVRRHLDSLRSLNTFLDKIQRQLPKESVPTKEEADKTIKQARAVLEEMYEKQSILDSTKTQVRELLRRKQSVLGADRLHDEMEEVAARWKGLHDAFKDKIRLMEEMKDFHDTHANLSQWLGAKERMMAALGPISTDSRMVQTQVQQLVHLEEVGNAVLDRLDDKSPDAVKLKQKVTDLADRWNDLLSKLEQRADSLGAAADTSREFDAGLTRLRDALQTISDKLDDVAMENEPEDQLRKIEVRFGPYALRIRERQLEGQRPLLADLEGAGAALSTVLSDPASRQDIQSKLAAVARQYDNLQRKLDHRKAEIEAALKDGRNLEENVARTLGWLQSELGGLPSRLQEHCRKFHKAQESFVPWLGDAESRLAQLPDTVFTKKEVEKQLKQLQLIRNDIWKRSGEYENNKTLGETFISACDVDQDVVRSQLDSMKERWDRLNNEVLQQVEFLESTARKLGEFSERVRGVETPLQRCEERLLEALAAPPARAAEAVARLTDQIHALRAPLQNLNTAADDIVTLALESSGPEAAGRARQVLEEQAQALGDRLDALEARAGDAKGRLAGANAALTQFQEHCRKFHKAQESFVPWLGDAESRLAQLPDTVFTKKEVEKQLKQLQLIRNDIWKRSGEYENNKTLGETFISACDVDQDVVRSQLDSMKERWDRLNNEVLQQVEFLESTARKLGEFSERVRGVETPLQRCEERLLEALAAPPARAAEAVARLTDQIHALRAPLQNLNTAADDIVTLALESSGPEAAGRARQVLEEQAQALGDRLDALEARAGDAKGRLAGANAALTQFQEKVKSLSHDLSDLEKELDGMKPPGRDIKTVKQQLDDIGRYYKRLEKADDLVGDTERAADTLVDSGYTDTANTRDQLEGLRKQLGKLDERARAKEQDLDDTLSKLEAFYKAYDSVMDDVQEAGDQVRNLKPVSSEVEQIRAQQKDFTELKRRTLEPLAQSVAHCNKAGQGLVRSALQGRRLDVGLLQSGKFAEALAGLEKWLADTEDMVHNQKPPSADYKVVKAQLQEQKFLRKMLMDRQNSVSSLFAMGNEVAAGCTPAERQGVEKQLKGLMHRFDALTVGAQQRMLDLEQAMKVAKQFQEELQPLVEWLGGAERQVKSLQLVPTDEEKIQQKIREHTALHDDIISKQPPFKKLTETASTLMGLVGDDEATTLADKLQAATDRYQALVDHSLNVGELLDNSRKGLRHLVLTYQDLSAWMDGMEQYLGRRKEKTEEIAAKQEAVDSTVESGLELMKHISGDEALQLKDKLDVLQRRYNDLTARGAELLRVASETLPLLQQFYNNHTKCTSLCCVVRYSYIVMLAQRSLEVVGDMEELLEWLRSVDSALRAAEPPSSEASEVRQQLKEQRPLNDEVAAQRVRVLRECQSSEETAVIRDRSAELKEMMEEVGHLSADRLAALEQALPRLRAYLTKWHPTDAATIYLGPQAAGGQAGEDGRGAVPAGGSRRRRQGAGHGVRGLRPLEGMLRALSGTADQLQHAEPVSAHPPKIKDQIEENDALVEDLEKRQEAYNTVQRAASEVISKANKSDPAVEKVRKTGSTLMSLCGEPDKPEVKKHMEDLDSAWDNVTALYARREENLIDAMEKAMEFHDTLQNLQEFLDTAEEKFCRMGALGSDIDAVKRQIAQLASFKQEVDPHMVKKVMVLINIPPILYRQAQELTERTSSEQASAIKQPLTEVNGRWSALLRGMVERQQQLERALLRLGQLQHALEDTLTWIKNTSETLDTLKPVAGDPQILEVELAKLKVLVNDIAAHQASVDTLNDAGAQIVTQGTGTDEAGETAEKLATLNKKWRELQQQARDKQSELEQALREAQRASDKKIKLEIALKEATEFHDALQAFVDWLTSAEKTLTSAKPVSRVMETLLSDSNRRAQILPKGNLHPPRNNAAPRQKGNAPQILQSEARRHSHQESAGVCAASMGEGGVQGS